jgi:molybdenum ABC transporter molybdate-binding protein
MSRLSDARLSRRHLVAGMVGAVALPVASSALLPLSPAYARAASFAVGEPTLQRFYALHYLLPFVIVAIIGLHLVALHQFNTASRQTLLGNTLVLVAPKDSAVALTIGKDFPLLEALGPDGKLAMASVESVPAGKYGKTALINLGVWDAVSPRVVQAENVRAALVFVARGEAPLGIVYGTDAKAEPAAKVVDVFPEQSHPKIQYSVALLASAKPEARKFLDFLESPEMRPAFEAQGFTVLGGQR